MNSCEVCNVCQTKDGLFSYSNYICDRCYIESQKREIVNLENKCSVLTDHVKEMEYKLKEARRLVLDTAIELIKKL